MHSLTPIDCWSEGAPHTRLQGSSALGWIHQHEKLVIGICVGVGSFILLAIFFCIVEVVLVHPDALSNTHRLLE
jgi:tRNA A37 threonylcarbamoyladenosine dehydratase